MVPAAPLAFALALAGCSTPDTPAAPKVLAPSQGFTLLYSGNLDGEIEPCG